MIKLWVDKETKNVLKRQEFALSGRLLRTSYYPKWKKVYSESKGSDVWYPQEIRFYDEVEKANSDAGPDQGGRPERAAREPVHQGLAREQEPVTSMRAGVVAALLAAWTGTAWAQAGGGDRPSEQDIFGGSAPAPAAPATPGAPAAPAPPPAPPPGTQQPGLTPPAAAAATEATGTERDRSVLGTVGEGGPEHLSDYQAPENPLQIGGQIYLRAQSTALSEATTRTAGP